MDPLTHMLAGTAVADVLPGCGKLGKAALPSAMALAALPDIDVFPAFVAAFPRNPYSGDGLFDADVMRAMHPSYTHALTALVITAADKALRLLW